MREIICAQIGQCGNNIGQQFWQLLCQEHGLSPYDGRQLIDDNASTADDRQLREVQRDRLGVYFDETPGGRHVPRAVLVDLENGPLQHVKASTSGQLFHPDSFVTGNEGAGNNWGKGHYTDGAELFEPVCDVIRREAERCDCLQGFQIVHSTGGGTGSGFTCLLTNRFREEYPDRMLNSYSIIPSSHVSDVVVEPYNTVLTLHHLIEDVDLVDILDNKQLYDIYSRTLKVPSPTLHDLNKLVSLSMSGTTCCLRFPGQLNADLRKLAVNMVPFPRLHFFTPSLAPLCGRQSQAYTSQTNVSRIIEALFQPQNALTDCDPSKGCFLTAAAIFRGNVSMRDVEQHMCEYSNKHSAKFVDWVPNNMKIASCEVAPLGYPVHASFISNLTSVHETMSRICKQFSIMFRRKAFVHWYTSEGMEAMEFIQAESNVLDLATEYRSFEFQEAPQAKQTGEEIESPSCELESSTSASDTRGSLLSVHNGVNDVTWQQFLQAATDAPPLQLDKLPTVDPAVNLKEFMKDVEENAGKPIDGEYAEVGIDEVLQSSADNAAE